MKEGGIYIEMYALARIQFQKLSCDHPHAAERTLYSESVNMWKNHGVVMTTFYYYSVNDQSGYMGKLFFNIYMYYNFDRS